MKDVRYAYALLILLVLLSASLVIAILNCEPISPDAGYYLPLARRIADGAIPFIDIRLGYTPVGIYLFALVEQLYGGDAPYNAHILLLIGFASASSVIVFIILSRCLPRLPCAIWSILFFISQLLWEGAHIVLEPFVSFFLLLAIVLLQKGKGEGALRAVNVLVAGIAFCLAVMSKQYAMLALPALLLNIYLRRRSVTHGISQSLVFLIGSLLPLALFIFYFVYICHVSFFELYSNLINIKYGPDYGHIYTIPLFIYQFPAILLLPYAITRLKHSSLSIPILCGIGCMLVLLIRQYEHYYLLFLPSVIIFSAYIGSSTFLKHFARREEHRIIYGMQFITILVTVFYALNYLSQYSIHKSYRDNQYYLASKINQTIPKNTPVILLADARFFYLSHLIPDPHLSLNYGYIIHYSELELDSIIAQGALVISDTSQESYHAMLGNLSSLSNIPPEQYFISHNYRMAEALPEGLQIWRR